ncbi:MAG TPA: inorganic phosphate transporter [Cyclobacteriaceae bacterium]|nr:inorganic phosphate transporter [Cyclobacteriaceae bacterium]
MFDLELSYSILLIICLVAACSFEFVNGFHDTANAVATVIYTNSLKPWVAVIWSGFMNSMGVFYGGIAVAMGIVNLLPVESLIDQNIAHSISMVAALLLSAITWNLLTWYFGIPCSSSHTLIGSILGVGIAYSFLPDSSATAVNWTKAQEIGISLMLSPLVGFSLTIILMYFLRVTTKGKSYGDDLFKEPKKNTPPPPWIRGILLLTCTGVSFFHGQNDGQKGVGLIMLILIGIVPGYFALNASFETYQLAEPLTRIENSIRSIDPEPLSAPDRIRLTEIKSMNSHIRSTIDSITVINELPRSERFGMRKDILVMARNLDELIKKDEARVSAKDKSVIKDSIKSIRKATDYSPGWVIVLISLSLGLGTMIGWKRIVKTIGEKIGKEHLSYAQGASAELVAASTIGMSSYLGLPVSTTHVLSSGIAGSMVASKGVKNLQPDTVRNILIAWLLTLPVVVIMSGSLFLLFRTLF